MLSALQVRLLTWSGKWFLLKPIQQMPNGQPGVPDQHPGAGKTHDSLHASSHICPVTMDRAFGAGGLPFLKGTMFQACQRVRFQFQAILA
jgi:hypothetical protein